MVSDMLGTNTEELNRLHLAELGHQYGTVVSSAEVMDLLKAGKL